MKRATNSHCITCNADLSKVKRKGRLCKGCSTKAYLASDAYKAKLQRRNEQGANRNEKLANPIRYLLGMAARRARSKGIEFSIADSDISIPELCPLLEIPLRMGTVGSRDNSPSIDRIDNYKGYVPGNVRIISNLANSIKHSASPEQLLIFAKNIAAYLASAK